MGNQLNSQDLNGEGYLDTGMYQKVISQKDQLFGRIEVLKLSNKPKSANTHNQLILNSDTSQLFMSISSKMPKLALNQILKSVIQLQKSIKISEKDPNAYQFIKFIEMGQKVQGKLEQKGIIVEYFQRSLQYVIGQRIQADQYFSESELWYLIESLTRASQNLLNIPYLDYILKQAPYNEQNVLLTDQGNIRVSSIALFLINNQSSDPNYYKEINEQARTAQIKQEQQDNGGSLCGAGNDRKQKPNMVKLNHNTLDTSRKSVFDIGLIALRLGVLITSVDTDIEQALQIISQNYSKNLFHTISNMLEVREKRPTLAEIIQEVMLIKDHQQFATNLPELSHLQQSQIEVSNQSLMLKPETPQEFLLDSPGHDNKLTLKNSLLEINHSKSFSKTEGNKLYSNYQDATFQDVQIQPISYIQTINDNHLESQMRIELFRKQYEELGEKKLIQYNNHPYLSDGEYTQTPNTTQTLDERIQSALFHSRQLLSGNDQKTMTTPKAPQVKFSDQKNYDVKQIDQDFDAKFWRVIQEAKQHILVFQQLEVKLLRQILYIYSMDSNNNQQAQIILCVSHVQLCIVQGTQTQLLESTEMNFASLPNGQVFLSIGHHIFTLQKTIPIYLTAYETQRSYLYSFVGEIYSIILQVHIKIVLKNSQCQQQFETINKIFDANALLVVKDKKGNQFQDQGHTLVVLPNKSAWHVLTDGAQSVGTTLSKGIVGSGQFVANGITSIGTFVESKITPSEPIKISKETRSNVRLAKDVSGKALVVTGSIVMHIIEMNLKLAQMMAQTVVEVTGIKNSKGQDNDPKKQEIKNFAKNTFIVTLAVLDSLDKAAEQVGTVIIKYIDQALGQQATRIIEKKFGKDASELFNEGVQVVGNLGDTYKDIKQAEIKAIVKATTKETIKQINEQV